MPRFGGKVGEDGEGGDGDGVRNGEHAEAFAGAGCGGAVLDPNKGAVKVGGETGGLEVVLHQDVHLVEGQVVGGESPGGVCSTEFAKVGDAIGSGDDVVEPDGLEEGVGNAGAGLTVLLDDGDDLDVLDVAVMKHGSGIRMMVGLVMT